MNLSNLSVFLILLSLALNACQPNPNDPGGLFQSRKVCEHSSEILPPEGYALRSISTIDYEGFVKAFQFVNEEMGYAMMGKNVGSTLEVLKTTDGGLTWTPLELQSDQYPRGMAFWDENIGIVTVHDVSGCPPPNCQNKCVLFKTENGGQDWTEIELPEQKGILYHPQFDEVGNLYANLQGDQETTLMKSTDQGTTWKAIFSSPELYVSNVIFSLEVLEDRLYLAGKDGKLLVVDTAGTLLQTLNPPFGVWDLEVLDPQHLVAANPTGAYRSSDGGQTWQTIYEDGARIIGFETQTDGLVIMEKSICPTDVYQVNDLIASTEDGGTNWTEAEATATNLRLGFVNSQRMGTERWYWMLGNQLWEIKAD